MDQVRVTSELALQARSSRQVAIVDDVDTGGSENNLRWGMPSTQSADYSGVSLKLDKEMIEPSCGREGYQIYFSFLRFAASFLCEDPHC